MKYLFAFCLLVFSFNSQASVAFELPKQNADTTANDLQKPKVENNSNTGAFAILTSISTVGAIIAFIKFVKASNDCGPMSQSCPENILPGLIGALLVILAAIFGIITLISLTAKNSKKKRKQ